MVKIKIVYSVNEKTFEDRVNDFLTENKDKIDVVDIKWKCCFCHYAMIIYNEL